MELLQAAGVRAGALQTGRDRLDRDPALASRQVFQRLSHDVLGEHRFESLPVHVDGEPLALYPRWPILGKDTEAVLGELGANADRIAELAKAGATWPPDIARPIYSKETTS
jgi:crotonobetainyl-CoA:carnitine CoA-transferase CaiB-like acyl-CoA transferase